MSMGFFFIEDTMSTIPPIQNDIAIAGAKALPIVAGGAWWKYTLDEWVLILTIIYIVVQIYVMLYKHFKNRKKNKLN